ncbi:MAG TPA: DUF969 domain-containing protein [Xanthomonadaceae bacterium]|jgi:uncharacterized membrane protein|nr:DUF969 domain-containing protein [Xanthomonadaceae bacterium]
MSYWPLIGVVVVVLGFALRLNPVLVVVSAGFASGFAAGKSFAELLILLGASFLTNRVLMFFVLTLPVIGVLERSGLREHAQRWIASLRGLTLAKLLIGYLAMRQFLSMLGLTNVAGHAQTVRPLLAPMSEAAAEKMHGELSHDGLSHEDRQSVRAMAAATDNIGLFFGEDVFLALGAVLLIQGFYAGNGIKLEPLQIAIWALPTAIAAFVIHSMRIVLFQRRLAQRIRTTSDSSAATLPATGSHATGSAETGASNATD